MRIESFYLGNDLIVPFTKQLFEEVTIPVRRRLQEKLEAALEEAELNKDEDVSRVLLVGGSTRIPWVRQWLKEFFGGQEPDTSLNPDTAVSEGAAKLAGKVAGADQSRLVVNDATSHSIGIQTAGGGV